ncbi:MAG: TerC family protein [Polyangiaceae bacterium]
MLQESVGTPALWIGFLVFVLALLALDLGVFHRKAREVTTREAAVWSLVWFGLAVAFNGLVYGLFGRERAVELATGYLIEKALAVDNIFVFVLIFAYFRVPSALQHRVLFWGILGALVMRAGFVLVGGAVLSRYHAAIYLFGALLFVTGVRLLFQKGETSEIGDNVLVRALRRVIPVSAGFSGGRFFVKEGGRWLATPLFLALVTVEISDVVFAVDSIPAIFAVSRDPFIVLTSNIFAILGLRSMYFLLAGVVQKFRYLKVGLALILVFVGAKMALSELYKVPVATSLGVIALLLLGSVAASLLRDTWLARAEGPGGVEDPEGGLAPLSRAPGGNTR